MERTAGRYGISRERLIRYDRIIERVYYILLTINIAYECMQSTEIVLNVVKWFAARMPGLSVDQIILLFQSLFNIRFFIVIPAFYVIFMVMTKKRERIIALFMIFLGWFYMFHMREWSDTVMFNVMILIVSSYGRDYRKIARCCIFAVGGVICLSVVLSLAGVISEYNLERDGRERHSYGFLGPTGLAGRGALILIMMMFVKNGRLQWYDYFLIFSWTAFNIVLVDGRIAFIATVLATGGCLVCQGWDRYGKAIPEKLPAMFRKLLIWSYLIVGGGFYLLVFTYSKNGGFFYQKLPGMGSVESRIEVPHRMMQELPFSFFGNYLEKYNDAEHSFNQIGEYYTFLDSSYARLYFIYGVVGLVFGLTLLTVIQWRLYKEKRTFSMYLLAVWAIFFIMQKGMLDPSYNIFPLLLWAKLPDPAGSQADDRVTDNTE